MEVKELLDYCRVKKISEKGYGFLTSLHYPEPVFFHFQRIKDPETKEKLEKLKRGEVYLYFTSGSKDGKRRVLKLWLDIKLADQNLIPDFIDRIISELNSGRTNIFELAYVVKQLRENNYLTGNKLREIISSEKILKTPSAVKAILTEGSFDAEKLSFLIEQSESKKITNEFWTDSVLDILNSNS